MTKPGFDVAVIGAGVFGAWTAYQLRLAGADVVLVDAYGPGNSRASSGGESRIIRLGYGPDEIYTLMVQRSLAVWQELFNRTGNSQLFQPTGVLWLARENDPYCEATLATFTRCGVAHERMESNDILRSYPQLDPGPASWGILEPGSGVLMARRAVQGVLAEARALGVTYEQEKALPPEPRYRTGSGPGSSSGQPARGSDSDRVAGGTNNTSVEHHNGKLSSLPTASGGEIRANEFVFACGPWLPKIFPSLLAELIHVTRQEVFFFGVPADAVTGFGPEDMPAWIDFNDLVYGIPNLDQRGFKIAIDEHGPAFDPDTGERIVSPEGLAAVRACLTRRMPALANAPVTETRVCQYENTSNGDFLIDRHPAFENVWLVGGGSGHGFKHGPAIGEHVAALISGDASVEPRFSLATKQIVQHRRVF